MKSLYRACCVLGLFLSAFLFQADSSLAQVPNSIDVNATGMGNSIKISVDLDIGGTLSSDWVGWVLDRSTLGNCDDPDVQIGAMNPFPEGEQSYVFGDFEVDVMTTYKYRVYAVDAAGERHYLPAYTEFPPGYYHFDYASASTNGIVAEGVLTDVGWAVGLVVCWDDCWEPIAFISNPPAEFVEFAPFSVPVKIWGTIDAEFEGPYISNVTSWEYTSGCTPIVPQDETSWDGLKAMYR